MVSKPLPKLEIDDLDAALLGAGLVLLAKDTLPNGELRAALVSTIFRLSMFSGEYSLARWGIIDGASPGEERANQLVTGEEELRRQAARHE